MKFWLGNTDFKWFNYLRREKREDINFWQPGGKTPFKVLEPGAPFLLRLKAPYNVIAGVGFYSSHAFLPLSVAWDMFGERNGVSTFNEFSAIINRYRGGNESNPTIGCIVLTNPVFFNAEDWIPQPTDWASSIVQGKSYDTGTPTGSQIWQQVDVLLQRYHFFDSLDEATNQFTVEETSSPLYKTGILSKVRVGQGAFRVMVMEAYSRRCAITGEKTLPVLEAAHIRPYAEAGPNMKANGLLLRSDLHKLFDTGYLTVTPDYKIEVSSQIREQFQNGKEYYKHHGNPLAIVPSRLVDVPSKQFLTYHNTNIFKP